MGGGAQQRGHDHGHHAVGEAAQHHDDHLVRGRARILTLALALPLTLTP